MTLVHTYNGSDLASKVQLANEKGFAASAVLGEVESVTVIVDDPDGTLIIEPYKVWRMRETACPAGNQDAWYGMTGDTKIARNIDGETEFTDEAGRQWSVELHECNKYLNVRVARGADAVRPRETVSDRIAWLITQPGFDTENIHNFGGVESSDVMLDERNYNGLFTGDVLRDCALASGFNFYARRHESTDDMELVFQAQNSAADASELQISNDGADVDEVTTFPPMDYPVQVFGSSRVASGCWLPYTGGAVYGINATTEATYDIVDQVAPTGTINRRSTAEALRDHFLAQHSTQDERVDTARLLLPAAKLNIVKKGQLVNAKFTHMRNGPASSARWTGYRPCRVTKKTFGRPPNRSQGVYEVELELVPVCLGLGIVQDQDFTHEGSDLFITWPGFEPAAGSLLLVIGTNRDSPSSTEMAATGWTFHINENPECLTGPQDGGDFSGPVPCYGPMWMATKISDGTETGITFSSGPGFSAVTGHVFEITGASEDILVGAKRTYGEFVTTLTTNAITPTAGQPYLICGFFWHGQGGGPQSMFEGSGWGALYNSSPSQDILMLEGNIVESASGSYAPDGTSDSNNAWRSFAFAVPGQEC